MKRFYIELEKRWVVHFTGVVRIPVSDGNK